jgi:hypothetical protein
MDEAHKRQRPDRWKIAGRIFELAVKAVTLADLVRRLIQ